jgi:hypothetical protein
MTNKIIRKIYIALTGSIVFSVGILHLLRIIYKVPVLVGSFDIPMFPSYLGLIGSIGISVLAMWLMSRKE